MRTPAPIYATHQEIQFLCSTLEVRRPQIAVEIGTWLGGTAQIFMNYAQRLYCIDHWRGDGNVYEGDFPGNHMTPWQRFRSFVEAVDDRFLDSVFPCVGDSRLWCQVWNQPIDFLYVDGNHSYEGCKADLLGWVPHVRPGGFVLGHDYETTPDCMFPGVARAVDEVLPLRTLIPHTRFWSLLKP